MEGIITDIQRCCTHDGPGVRTSVFLKGCPLRCRWCHNPETQIRRPQTSWHAVRCLNCGACVQVCPESAHVIRDGQHRFDGLKCSGCMRCRSVCEAGAIVTTGYKASAEEILKEVGKDRAFYGKNGGMTLTGGEPMFQPEFSIALLRAATEAGINTCMETCGYAAFEHYLQAAEYCGLFLWDIKDTNAQRHQAFTGVSPKLISDNLQQIDAQGVPTVIRCILVKGVNMEEGHFDGISALFTKLKHCLGVQLLSYHPMGGAKTAQLGLADTACREWVPSGEDRKEAAEYMKQKGVRILEDL